MNHRTQRLLLAAFAAISVLCLLSVGAYFLPPVRWRVDELRTKIRYALNPPEKQVFVPGAQVATVVQATLTALAPTQTETPAPTATPDPGLFSPTPEGPTASPTPPPTETPSPTPLPPAVNLKGVAHIYQKWNNCGPATLSMALTFWDWPPNLNRNASSEEARELQNDPAAWLKPNPRDKNVMPYEMEAFVEEMAGLQAVVRLGGDLSLLKQLLAAGFPVLVEQGFDVHDLGWMGHYRVLVGYDDTLQQFTAQDSYIGPNLKVSYADLETYWQHFNYLYLVIYTPEREADLMAILGPQADETYNYRYAMEIAQNEIATFEGAPLYYAWFNFGSALVKLQDYTGAAGAFDQSFALYPSIPEKERPWRMVWYQTTPYFAYFYTGRYTDVLNLASNTLNAVEEPSLEESWYWRAQAKNALGDVEGAIADLRESLTWHPNFAPSLGLLEQWGAAP
jgi:hypothetical protein